MRAVSGVKCFISYPPGQRGRPETDRFRTVSGREALGEALGVLVLGGLEGLDMVDHRHWRTFAACFGQRGQRLVIALGEQLDDLRPFQAAAE